MFSLKNKCFWIFYTSLPIVLFTIFMLGFFPIKRGIPGQAALQKYTFENVAFAQPNNLFDKLVIVVIDALRSDFVFDKGKRMPFVQNIMNNGFSRSFTVTAHPPTVTLPRIKAITTGSIPGFVDVALNLDSSALVEDNIIDQAHKAGKKLVFYGDDTWIRLFPDKFERSDGTTSFFVTDYTEVDTNVTRHLDEELSDIDWDVMILHYLGLDHIGHTAGPASPLVGPKLLEMDNVVRRIYTALEHQGGQSVILICGDHGISDQGSHGGASEKEVLVPAIFLSPQFPRMSAEDGWASHRENAQIDVTPTLSILLGLPIPMNNLGQVLVGALDGYDMDTVLQVMYINALQIFELLKTNVPNYLDESSYHLYQYAVQQYAIYLKIKSSEEVVSPDRQSRIKRAYETAIDGMVARIAKTLTKFDLYAMLLSVILLLMILVSVVLLLEGKKQLTNMTGCLSHSGLMFVSIGSVAAMFGHVTVCTSQSYHSSIICGWSLLPVVFQLGLCLTTVLLLCLMMTCCRHTIYSAMKYWPSSALEKFLLLGTLYHSVSFVSSSCVEEEHQTWYFLAMTSYIMALGSTVVSQVRKQLCSKKPEVTNFCGCKGLSDHQRNLAINDSLLDGRGCSEQNYIHHEQKQYCSSCSVFNQNETTILKPCTFVNTSAIDAMLMEQIIYSSESKLQMSQGIKDRLLPWKHMLPWSSILATIAVMCLGRCLRSMNQTGNKWQNLPDVGDWLIRPENKPVLSLLVPASMLFLVPYQSLLVVDRLILGAGLYGCYRYRVSTGTINSILSLKSGDTIINKGLTEAAWVYLIIILMNITSVIKWIYLPSTPSSPSSSLVTVLKIEMIKRLQLSWIVLMTLLLRPHNTIMVAMVVTQEWLLDNYILKRIPLSVPYFTLLCWWMGQAVYFQQGNSNSIASVDLSAGYVGLESYRPILIGLLLFAATYAGPIFWMISLLKLIYTRALQDAIVDNPLNSCLRKNLLQAVQALMTERLLTLTVYTIVVTIMRYHIFVWTVFSPKLLYEGTLTAMFTIVSVGFISIS